MPTSFLKIGTELIRDAILDAVEITQEFNQHWWCTVVCRQTPDVRFPAEDSLGDLQIVTTDQQGTEHVIFDGLVLEAWLVYEVFRRYGSSRLAWFARTDPSLCASAR